MKERFSRVKLCSFLKRNLKLDKKIYITLFGFSFKKKESEQLFNALLPLFKMATRANHNHPSLKKIDQSDSLLFVFKKRDSFFFKRATRAIPSCCSLKRETRSFKKSDQSDSLLLFFKRETRSFKKSERVILSFLSKTKERIPNPELKLKKIYNFKS